MSVIPMKLALLALPLAFAAVPAAAQSLADTHEMRWATPGKTTPLVSYHPRHRTCAQHSAPLHLSGKTPHMSAAPSGCAAAIAKAEHKPEVAARD